MKNQEISPPPLTHQKKKNQDFLLFLENWRHRVACPRRNDPQELSNNGPLRTGYVFVPWPHPHLAATSLCFTYQAHLKTPQRNEASKIPSSLVLNHLPWPAFHSTSQKVPKTWRFWNRDWFPVCGFDSSTWSNTWHNFLRLPVFPAHFAPTLLHQEGLLMFHAAAAATLRQPQKPSWRLPICLALTVCLSLLWFPTHSFFQGPPGGWPSNFVSCFHPWYHLLDLTTELSSCFNSGPVCLKPCLWLFVLTKSSAKPSSSSWKYISQSSAHCYNQRILNISRT